MSFNHFPPLKIPVRFLIILALFGLVNLSAVNAEDIDLDDMSLEQLMDIEITSVSKKEQKISEAAAAIYVITQEDIRRSGATSIADALRMAPGVNVGQILSHKWSISVRGFQEQLSSKLLVMIDGRTVYTPLFSGTYWDVQDYILEDIERIEIIRGPGATLWGANAVNGVINIITKHAKDSQGGLLSAGGGEEEQVFGEMRYGGLMGEAHYRVYAKYFQRDDLLQTRRGHIKGANDDWDMLRGGFRFDWDIAEQDNLTVQGDIYYADISQTAYFPSITPPFVTDQPVVDDKVSGGNLLARWTRTLSDSSDFTLQMYYDRTQRDDSNVNEIRDIIDIDFQHTFGLGERHSLIWGLGSRYSGDDTEDGVKMGFRPKGREDYLFSAFIQDEITLIEERLRLTIGSKFEHNEYTGWEVQPSIRMIWTPDERQSIWAAVSRAVRTPNRIEDNISANTNLLPPNTLFPGQPLGTVRLVGNDSVESETLLAYELGYRIQATPRLSLDIATFYNDYEDLLFVGEGYFGTPFMDGSLFILPLVIDNVGGGETYGVELVADWRPTNYWRLAAGYSYLEMDLGDTSIGRKKRAERGSPQNQINLRSYLSLPHNLQFDTTLYYVDSLNVLSAINTLVPIREYYRLDARLAWQPTENLELSVVGQNLLDPVHQEHVELTFSGTSFPERSVYGKLTWRF
jgi:iron complex outermembrane recepter protein